jgi:hypothetical protein
MVAAGQNLKRLIKHKSNELFYLFKELYLELMASHCAYFFNDLLIICVDRSLIQTWYIQ